MEKIEFRKIFGVEYADVGCLANTKVTGLVCGPVFLGAPNAVL